MDRQTTYSGQVPRVLDLLMAQQNTMVALAKLSASVFGTSTIVDGFTCTPTTPASLSVILTPGSIYQIEDLEQSAWSAVAQDLTHTILKQGILLDNVTLTVTPPSTVGFSQVYLLEVQYSDTDSGALVLPYYNAASPTTPFSGPGNAGTAQNTIRKGAVAYQMKAGTAAPSGSQVTPAADAGWVGLFAVTVAQGQTTVTAGNITTVLGTVPGLPTSQQSPFIPTTLPQVPVASQAGMWMYAADTSVTASAMTATFNPAISTLVPGMTLRVKVGSWATTNFTGNISTGSNQLTSVSPTTGLTNGQLLYGTGIPGGTTIQSGAGTSTITMSANATATTTGLAISAKGNAGACTLNVGTGNQNVVRASGAALIAGDIYQAGDVIQVTWDGSQWQMTNYLGAAGGGATTINNTFNTFAIPYCADTGAANAINAPFSPAITAPTAGNPIIVKIANATTGPTTIQVNALSPVAVVNQWLQPLGAGDLVAGEMALMIYTGTVWAVFVPGKGGSAGSSGGGGYTNLLGSAAGGTKTASWSADEIVAEQKLGGISVLGASVSLSFNGANVGANGMDTGATPNASDISIYAIFNPSTNTWATLGTTASTGKIYSGSNMPAGYTASVLIWSGKTDTSNNIVKFNQYNSRISIVTTEIAFNGSFNVATTMSLASVIPANAKTVAGYIRHAGGDAGPAPLTLNASTGFFYGVDSIHIQNDSGTTSGLTNFDWQTISGQTIYVYFTGFLPIVAVGKYTI